MRILHVVPSYLPAVRYGGPIYSVHALCRALAARGHDVHVYTTNVDGDGVSSVPLDRPVVIDGVNVSYFPVGAGRRLYRSPAMGRALAATIGGFAALHLHSVFLWPTLAAAGRARRAGVPYVLAPRGMLVPDLIRSRSRFAKALWIAAFERRNLAGAAALHVTSQAEADDLAALGLARRPIALLPNGIDLPRPAPRDARPPGPPVILSLGRISWKKGLDRLIEALAQVPDAHLVIAGNDEEDQLGRLRALADRLGLGARVSFPGPAYGDAKWRLIGAADVFVMPSRSENFGIAALEAMACGVPVVVTPGVGLAAAVRTFEAGIVVEADAVAIAQALRALLASPQQRARMGAAGRRAAAEQFSWPHIAEATERLYAEIVA